MPIDLARLRRESLTETAALAKSVRVRKASQHTAFLCHSHDDQDLVQGFLGMMRGGGVDIYVDWLDTSLPATPDRTTASAIQNRIRAADYFLFLATPNSTRSRWCPWEIGFADGVRPIETIFVVTTRNAQGNYGNEYLGLYREIDISDAGHLGVWTPGDTRGTLLEKVLR